MFSYLFFRHRQFLFQMIVVCLILDLFISFVILRLDKLNKIKNDIALSAFVFRFQIFNDMNIFQINLVVIRGLSFLRFFAFHRARTIQRAGGHPHRARGGGESREKIRISRGNLT